MGFNFEKNNIPSQEEIDKIKKAGRRGFIKGAAIAGAAGAASHIEKKGEKMARALNFIKNAFTNNDKPQFKANNIEIKNIADHFLKAFEELKMKEKFFPKEIFTRDLLIAQQLQESQYKANAKSRAGAVGTMQNMDISIKDVSQFLEKLDNAGIIEYNGPIYLNTESNKKRKEKFGKRIFRQSDFIALRHLRIDNPDYSKALGKLYLMQLSNEEYGYGVGQKLYKQGKTKDAQAEILGAYNAGYSRVKDIPRNEWQYKEPREYVKRIFNYMERLKNVRNAMENAGLNRENDSIAMRISREMNKVRGHGHTRKKLLNKTMNYLIEAIKKEQEKKGRELKEEEIIKVFSTFANVKDITTEKFYAKI